MLKVVPSPCKLRGLRFLFSVLAGGVFVAGTGALAHGADKDVTGSSVKRGEALFHQRCAVCHNKQPGNDSPFGPPNLYDVFRAKKITAKEATTIIHTGKGQMPSFGQTISNAQIRDVIAYLSAH